MIRLLTTTPLPLALAGVLYVLMAIAYWRSGQRGLALAFLAYALANVGFVAAWYEVP